MDITDLDLETRRQEGREVTRRAMQYQAARDVVALARRLLAAREQQRMAMIAAQCSNASNAKQDLYDAAEYGAIADGIEAEIIATLERV